MCRQQHEQQHETTGRSNNDRSQAVKTCAVHPLLANTTAVE